MEYFIWDANPVFFTLGSIKIHWYGLLFATHFFLGLLIMEWIYRRENKDPAILSTLLFYMMIGTVVGARLGHCFFYEPDYFLQHPIEIITHWRNGLASHGALAGILIAIFAFARRHKQSYIWMLSRMTIPGTLSAAFVRIGNFFNSEILGKQTDVPWAVIFKRVDMIPRHPVQLYEALSYFVILIILLTVYKRTDNKLATRLLPGIFLIAMFSVRFLLEFTKTRQATYSSDMLLSTGQLLSIPYVLAGVLLLVWALKSERTQK